MSSALAIAGVTAVLRDLLNDGLINHDITSVVGTSITVSIGPPDRVVAGNGTESSQLNLFLYQVAPNTGWRNEGLPSRDVSGSQRLSNPPLALNLHFLLSAYSGGDLHGEILLGYAMQLLHEMPVLTRSAIKAALIPSTADTNLPPALQSLSDSGLEDQVELIKITPEHLNTEDMSKLWTATQSHMRPSAAYMASVVLVESSQPIRSPLPVLQRGAGDQGVFVQVGASPILQSLHIGLPDEAGRKPVPPSWPVAQLGLYLSFHGNRLSGEQVSLRFEHPLMTQQDVIVPISDRDSSFVALILPDDVPAQTAWAAGIYTVSALVENDGTTRHSNALPLAMAARIITISNSVVRSASGDATITIQCGPELPVEARKVGSVWKKKLKQKVLLLLAGRELEPEALPDSAAATEPKFEKNLTFVMKNAPTISNEVARLRVDGVDSIPFVRRELPVPPRLVFDDQQKVTIT